MNNPYTPITTEQSEQQLKVLKFWHATEFFIPFDLQEVLDRNYYLVTFQKLQREGNASLPWLNDHLRSSIAHPAIKKATANLNPHTEELQYIYTLYLLPFDKSELIKICNQFDFIQQKITAREINTNDVANVARNLDSRNDDLRNFAFTEQVDDEGKTCFAKLVLNSSREVMVEDFSVSTLPWAIGKLKQHKINELCYEEYRKNSGKLTSVISLTNGYDRCSAALKINLSAATLMKVFELLYEWAGGFMPHNQHAVVILVDVKKVKKKERRLPLKEETDYSESIGSAIKSDKTQAKNSNNDEQAIDILNSFYIKDLEKAANYIKTNSSHHLITPLILGIKDQLRVDLYAPQNQQAILNQVVPAKVNMGRWPNSSAHCMSLMQQFAINEYFHPSTCNDALLAINGPPGTGKTTLLQEIIAENIVRRANVLAKLDNAAGAFKNKSPLEVNFTNSEKWRCHALIDDLTGYEMVVVSSNNNAVENISKDLPLLHKLGEKYQKKCSYLAEIAALLDTDIVENKLEPTAQKKWGLITAALGNMKNCNHFASKVFFAPKMEKKQHQERIDKGEYLTISEWANKYVREGGLSFNKAQQQFSFAQNSLESFLTQLKSFHTVYCQFKQLTENKETLCIEWQKKKEQLQQELALLQQQQKQLHREKNNLLRKQYIFDSDSNFLEIYKPNFLAKLFKTKNAKKHRQDQDNLIQRRRDIANTREKNKNARMELERKIKRMKQELDGVNNKIKQDIEDTEQLETKYMELKKEIGQLHLPPTDGNLESKDAQINAFWQNEQLNHLRSNLFIAALNLHQAWLAEVINNGMFSSTLYCIAHFIDGCNLAKSNLAIEIWRCLFMVVPVISSTFASVARLFRDVTAEQLGLLLIDEAAQAVPQAAIGALWRAKKAIIVGDPLQIEPVFTVPPKLVNFLADYFLVREHANWLPPLASVQSLADRATATGGYAISEEYKRWIGCPLRIHRRCADPMFTIANEIAYGNKMINARTFEQQTQQQYDIALQNSIKYPLGDSCWFHVEGETIDKQYVAEQGEFLLQLLNKLLIADYRRLPRVYIITPFKKIQQQIRRLIIQGKYFEFDKLMLLHEYRAKYHSDLDSVAQEQLEKQLRGEFNNEKIREWCWQRIGTVHTFQGKEEIAVILILGVDHKKQNGANWASSKPNLLNVALTRAKDRFYVIGDRNLWGQKNYFHKLAASLPWERTKPY